eukprot:CAMPEP_0178427408 /NCGR_PEP_ID=MMETSP0689_2-20121128/29732_1 /TAXON_ID=160604 /ORGANISM="Amphidinium massartii, Strain CS-259" /LENGTH=270 /DNA_ID=CAMNT_0020049119 /DNA_START=31 /DNA_END=843 /DNA_ORIENTATION=+
MGYGLPSQQLRRSGQNHTGRRRRSAGLRSGLLLACLVGAAGFGWSLRQAQAFAVSLAGSRKATKKEGITCTHQSLTEHQYPSSATVTATGTVTSQFSDSFAESGLPREPLSIVVVDVTSPLDFLDSEGKLDPYEVLGVRFLAPARAIKEAYKDKCRQLHPDKHGGEESSEWKLVSEAYALLSNRERKILYDQRRLFKAIWTVSFTGFVQLADFMNWAAENLGEKCLEFFNWVWEVGQAMSQTLTSAERNAESKLPGPTHASSDQAVLQGK